MKSTCECADRGCRNHEGADGCYSPAKTILYRIDTLDEIGTSVCDACADDAYESGLFTDRFDGEEEIA